MSGYKNSDVNKMNQDREQDPRHTGQSGQKDRQYQNDPSRKPQQQDPDNIGQNKTQRDPSKTERR